MHDEENKEKRGGGGGGEKGYIDKKIEARRMKIKGYRITRGYWTEIEGVGPWEEGFGRCIEERGLNNCHGGLGFRLASRSTR